MSFTSWLNCVDLLLSFGAVLNIVWGRLWNKQTNESTSSTAPLPAKKPSKQSQCLCQESTYPFCSPTYQLACLSSQDPFSTENTSRYILRYSLFPWRFSWIYTFLLNLKSSKQRLFRLFNIHIRIYIAQPQNVLKTAICELVYMFSFFLLFLKCFKLVTSKTKIFQLFNQRLEAISWPLIILLLLTGHKEKTAWGNHLIQNYFPNSCTYRNQI